MDWSTRIFSVGKIQDLFLHTAFQQAIYGLESDIRFTGTGCHGKEDSLLSSGNRIHSAVNRIHLIIARRIGRPGWCSRAGR